eukprot:CAMPEP_0168165166 /NCGR_PEP_ID=MMETSP0139_2-20121125/1341_1 /TAXON_ID=44445 /ORGANISM="Pseudo-nitzschia australis, Strain 10249 10 AB" /LENGTH=500 /DNA_ID=CAMNT_0008082263 /DNA_START=39 /DNA_END=1541 /DNA_ORIENTATION=-
MTTVESLEHVQVYKVPITAQKEKDGDSDDNVNEQCHSHSDSHSYILRGLQEEEVRPWSEFCASEFSYKKNPPPADYFYRHYANDPFKGSSQLIRVALYDNKIVASCRIFLRTISMPDTSGGKEDSDVYTANVKTFALPLRAGGIGEVCTSVEHRRRGISTALLKSAIAVMKERGLHLSSLHAAPIFFPLYEAMGYSSTTSGNRWSTVLLTTTSMSTLAKSKDVYVHANTTKTTTESYSYCVVRPAKFPQDTEKLQKLHSRYSEERLTGCIVRSSKYYWTNYLSKELEGSLFLLTLPAGKSEGNVDDDDKETILAWLSLQPTKLSLNGQEGHPGFQIQEFGTNLSIPTSLAVGRLVAHSTAVASRKSQHSDDSSSNAVAAECKCITEDLVVWLKLPGFVRDEIRAEDGNSSNKDEFRFDWKSERTEVDNGWMYQALLPPPNVDETDVETGTDTDTSTNTDLAKTRAVASDFLEFVRKGSNAGNIANHQMPREHFVWPSDSF